MSAGAGGKSSKAGRAKKSAQNLRYINEQRHDKSHVLRIALHLDRQPSDKLAIEHLKRYRARLGKKSA